MNRFDIAIEPSIAEAPVTTAMIVLIAAVVAGLCILACYLIRRAIRRAKERSDADR